jgi:hypothetical protein
MPEKRPTLFWFWPQRQRQSYDAHEWAGYERTANSAGFDIRLTTVDDVWVRLAEEGSVVSVFGEPIDQRQTLFFNKLYTWPALSADIWRSLSLFRTLNEVGYYLLIPEGLNILTNDKTASLAWATKLVGIDVAPTLAIPTRDFSLLDLPLPHGMNWPVIVKPAHWGAGKGVVRARNASELIMALRLASAAELTMLIQPQIGTEDSLEDIRVMCVDGEPLLSARRQIGPNRTVANTASGGQSTLDGVPHALREPAAQVAAALQHPWVGVDFLVSDTQVLLSEVEIDAYLAPSWMLDPRMQRVALARFSSYRAHFNNWLRTGH